MQSVNSIWNSEKVLEIPFTITQPGSKDLVLVVRNNEDYPYHNLFLFLEIPNITRRDTLQYRLSEPNGNWVGKGYGPTKEALFGYKKKLIFPKSGTYTLKIAHGMRKKTLVGIEDIGIWIRDPE